MFLWSGSGISILVDIGFTNNFASVVPVHLQIFEEINIFTLIQIILFFVLLIFVFKTLRKGTSISSVTGDVTLDLAIVAAGYSYDPKQDIFYSIMDPWQRSMGYCRLYDEAAAPMGMILDCEPIYFEYANKRWLIEFWKGQYALNTGCEVGVYVTKEPDLNISGIFKGAFYNSASNGDLLHISYTLIKNGAPLFTREDKHWWLTGFKLGEFSEPSELVMNLNITLKDKTMCNAFVKSLKNAGYSDKEIIVKGHTVGLKFDKPRTPQPITRTEQTDALIQTKNKLLCDQYQKITGPYDNMPDKLKAIREKAPELYEKVINIGKTEKLFDKFKIISKYLN
jgi:hypothetical protein